MKLIVTLLTFSILLGCFGESVSKTQISTSKQQGELSMFGIFNSKVTKNYVIASPLSGVLMKGGKALPNTKIFRRLTWNGNETGLIQEFMTNDEGYFTLPVHEEELTMSGITEFVASNTLYFEEEKDDNFFWLSPKRTEKLFSDYGGEIEGLVCDLDNEEKRVTPSGADTYIFSKCSWNNMP